MLNTLSGFDSHDFFSMLKGLESGSHDEVNSMAASRFRETGMKMISPDNPKTPGLVPNFLPSSGCTIEHPLPQLLNPVAAKSYSPMRKPRQLPPNLGIKPRNQLILQSPRIDLVQKDQVIANDLIHVPSDQETRYVAEHLDASTNLAELFGLFQEGDFCAGAGASDCCGQTAHAAAANADVEEPGRHGCCAVTLPCDDPGNGLLCCQLLRARAMISLESFQKA